MRRIVTILTCVCLVGCLNLGCAVWGTSNGMLSKEVTIDVHAGLAAKVECASEPNAGNDSPDGKVIVTGDVDLDVP